MVKLEEKRHFPRIRFKMPLRIQARGEAGFDNAMCNDISTGGLSFTANKYFSPDKPLMLEFNVFTRCFRPVGRVAWSQAVPHSDVSRFGVEFLEFPLTEKRFLSDYIAMQRGQI